MKKSFGVKKVEIEKKELKIIKKIIISNFK